MPRRHAVLLCLAALLLLAPLGCGLPGPGATPTPKGGTIVVALNSEPLTLDSQQSSDYNTSRACYGIYDRLLEFNDSSTEVGPGLAETCRISDDGLTYTLNLRRGVRFHDGTPLDAEAVKFNLERQFDPNHPFHDTGQFPYAEVAWGMVQSVTVLSRYSLQITLKAPFAPFLNHLAMHWAAMASPTAIRRYGKDFSRHPVGTGPFRFVEWKPGQEVVLERNRAYWGGAPNVERVIYRTIVDDRARLQELEAGRASLIVNVPPAELARLQAEGRFAVVEQPGMHTWWVGLNQMKAPFSDLRVRQALNYAVNKQAIIDKILQGTGIPAINPLPPVVWGYVGDVRRYGYDPARARQLLAEAGYPNGFSCTLWAPESGPGMQQPVAMAQAIQADLKAVGVDCRVETFDWGTYLQKVIVPPEQAGFDLFEMSWIGDNGDPDNHLYALLSGDQWPPHGYNMGFFKDPAVDALMQEARVTLSRSRRTELYVDVQKRLAEDAPWILVDHERQIVAMDKKIANFHLHPTGSFRFQRVWIEP